MGQRIILDEAPTYESEFLASLLIPGEIAAPVISNDRVLPHKPILVHSTYTAANTSAPYTLITLFPVGGSTIGNSGVSV
jgi:hypothetical protein